MQLHIEITIHKKVINNTRILIIHQLLSQLNSFRVSISQLSNVSQLPMFNCTWTLRTRNIGRFSSVLKSINVPSAEQFIVCEPWHDCLAKMNRSPTQDDPEQRHRYHSSFHWHRAMAKFWS